MNNTNAEKIVKNVEEIDVNSCINALTELDIKEEEVTTIHLNKLITNNKYILSCKSNKKKDKHSLSYLIDKSISQSDCIKLGNALEKVLLDLILEHTNLKNIKSKNEKGKKEKDHLFSDDNNKIIYYAELKANINLDTEKSKATYNKCLNIVTELNKLYPDYSIKWCLLSCRYLHNDNIDKLIKNKYNAIKDNLYGINQYMNLLKIKLQFEENSYKQFLNNIVDAMLKEE